MALDPEVTIKILEMTKQQLYAVKKNIYKETLRQLLHVFGNIYYIDGNGQTVQIKCISGKQERVIGKHKKDNTLVLPYITITEAESSNADSRRRYNPVLLNEKAWDPKTKRAKRVLSLSPRPVDLSYQINIWTKYVEDMDMIRLSIFSLFNPDLDLRTSFSDYTKAFIESENNIGESEALDSADRNLKRAFVIKVETYLPSPKFLFTNTGEIHQFNQEFQIFSQLKDMQVDDPDEVIENSEVLNPGEDSPEDFATLTVMNTVVGDYNVLIRQGYFHLYDSVPSVGENRQGWGEWHVIRAGSIIKSEYNCLNFSWAGLNGDVVVSRYVSKDGDKGGWNGYKFVITGTYSYHQYIAASGLDTNSGISPLSAVRTISKARANVEANLVLSGTHKFWIKEGETHSCSAAIWNGGDSSAINIHVFRWGNSSSAPTVSASVSSWDALKVGKMHSIVASGLNIVGGYSNASGTGVGLHLDRTGAGTRINLNCMLLDCTISDFHTGVKGTDSLATSANRETNGQGFLYINNTNIGNNQEYPIYGINYGKYLCLRNVGLGGHLSSFTPNPMRVTSQEHFYLEDVTFSGNNTGSIRFNADNGSGSISRYGTFNRLLFSGLDSSLNGVSIASNGGDGIAYFSDIRFVGDTFISSVPRFVLNAIGGSNSVDVKRFQFWNNSINYPINLNTQANGGTFDKIDIQHCGFVGLNTWAGDTMGVEFRGPASGYATNCVSIKSSFGYWPASGNDSGRQFFYSNSLDTSTVASKIEISDNNLIGKVDSNTIHWSNCTDGTKTLAQWQAATTHDDNSIVSATTTLNLTSGIRNTRTTASGPLWNAGYSHSYLIDGDKKVRQSTPDIGPYEFFTGAQQDATNAPETPPLFGW